MPGVMLLLITMGIPIFFAEVLDKEPPIGSVWLTFLSVGVVGFLLCRWRGGFIALALPAAALLSYCWLTELLDPYVGPAIWRESRGYVVQSYAATAAAVGLPCAGAWLRRRRDRLRRAAA